jgi:hypothetical protein
MLSKESAQPCGLELLEGGRADEHPRTGTGTETPGGELSLADESVDGMDVEAELLPHRRDREPWTSWLFVPHG